MARNRYRQYDMRCDNERASPLVNLNNPTGAGKNAEAKCLSVNPVQSHMLAVGANDEYVRLYDRRRIKAQAVESDFLELTNDYEKKVYMTRQPQVRMKKDDDDQHEEYSYLPQRFAAGETCYLVNALVTTFFLAHLTPYTRRGGVKRARQLTTTYCTFSADGRSLLANVGGEHAYLFATDSAQRSRLSSQYSFGSRENACSSLMDVPCAASNEEISTEAMPEYSPAAGKAALSDMEMRLKEHANAAFNAGKYTRAIHFYNLALQRVAHPVLYANRAAALLKRAW